MVILGSSNRKGQTILDLILVIIVLFVFGIVGFLAYYVLNEVNTDIQADEDIADVAKQDLQGLTTNFPQFMDNTFVLLLALLWIMLIVSSFLIDSHPVFFILTVVLLVFVFIVGMIVANAYQDIAADEDLISASSQFSQTQWVFENFLPIIISMGMSSALALYAKSRFGA